MSQVTNDRSHLPLAALYAPIEKEMERVEEILREKMSSRHPFVDELVRYGCMLGGKRLRPALLLLAAKSIGEVNDTHYQLAAVVEMIHTATLVHDDVLDDAEMRRHLATVNARWDNEASVLLGDYLFTHAFYLASTTGSTHACQVIGRSTNRVCEGEIRQKGSKANFHLSEEDYLEVIESKTAELCACCCELGAYYAGASDEMTENMAAFGRDLGIAFQIADDLLDLQGSEDKTGKTLGTDLESQKPTLPLIHTFQTADDATRDELEIILNGPVEQRLQRLLPYFERFGSFAYAQDQAAAYAGSAGARLDRIPESDSAQVLRAICEFVVLRSR